MATGIMRIKLLLSLAILTTSSMLAAQQDNDETIERSDLHHEIREARAELAEAARRMARLQRQLGAHATSLEIVRRHADQAAGHDREVVIEFDDINGLMLNSTPPRLGVLLGGPGSAAANEVIGLTPGGGAEAAGIEQGDRLVSVNGTVVTGSAPASIRDAMAGVEAGTSVPVVIERDGEQLSFDVETNSVARELSVFGLHPAPAPDAPEFEREIIMMHPDGPQLKKLGMLPELPFPPHAPLFAALGHDSELIGNHAGLEPYFGTAEGVVVLRIDPENEFALRDGDVVLRLDEETVNRPVDLGRLLLGRKPGEQVVFEVMRERVLTQIPATIPERSASIHSFPMRIEIKTAPEPAEAPVPPQPL